MLFYVVLFVVSISVAAIAIWCYRALTNAVGTVHQAIHPIWEEAYDKHLFKGEVHNATNRVATPQAEPKSSIVAQLRQARRSPRQEVSYAGSANAQVRNEFSIREQELESTGKTYRPKPQGRSKRSGTQKAKPWGW